MSWFYFGSPEQLSKSEEEFKKKNSIIKAKNNDEIVKDEFIEFEKMYIIDDVQKDELNENDDNNIDEKFDYSDLED